MENNIIYKEILKSKKSRAINEEYVFESEEKIGIWWKSSW